MRKSTLPNLLDTHPPFQIDGNFGGTAGIAEMLLQSHAGRDQSLARARLGPGPPADSAACGRGGVEVALSWRNSRATSAELKARVAGRHRVRPPRGQRIEAVNMGGNTIAFQTLEDGTIALDVEPEKTYRLTFR